MLRLAAATDPRWGAWAAQHIDAILVDHAHCEKKAASTALGLIFRYPDQAALPRVLSELAREELRHFELVLGHIQDRGIPFERCRPSPYAGRLMTIARTTEPAKLLDTLLCAALIEARSCERMTLLADALDAAGAHRELAAMYRGLLAAEARHHGIYLELAAAVGAFTDETIRARLAQVATHESAVAADGPDEPRLHNPGPPGLVRPTAPRPGPGSG